ncbi:GroES-like protein [Polychaeton citri CBS 116435]|uniref:GroES-like protein n=1 Tax=Polychaeton citri CBS 116435 TaxID=1314669 RepID=A0A9P4UMM3_9PEZI|nr:GroES-like protein [Polychaeton citri CBS 116435]
MAYVVEVLTRKPIDVAIHTTPDHMLELREDDKIPEPGKDECLVHVRATGICGSDVHFWKDGCIGTSRTTTSQGLGHESAGTIIKCGRNVTTLQPRDRVALECGISCMKSKCFHLPQRLVSRLPGHHLLLFAAEAWLHKIPESVSFEEGALLEPPSVALAGLDRSGLRLGDALVICGAGPIGMVSLLAANAAGATPIVITGLDTKRLEMAKRSVPRVRTVLVEKQKRPEEISEKVEKAIRGKAKLALECTGAESSVHTAIYSTRFGGQVYINGVGKDVMQIPSMYASFHEIDIRFQFRYRETYQKAITLVSEGLIGLKPLVTHRFRLDEMQSAFEAASDPSARAVKV